MSEMSVNISVFFVCRAELDPHVRDCVKSYTQPWLVVGRR